MNNNNNINNNDNNLEIDYKNLNVNNVKDVVKNLIEIMTKYQTNKIPYYSYINNITGFIKNNIKFINENIDYIISLLFYQNNSNLHNIINILMNYSDGYIKDKFVKNRYFLELFDRKDEIKLVNNSIEDYKNHKFIQELLNQNIVDIFNLDDEINEIKYNYIVYILKNFASFIYMNSINKNDIIFYIKYNIKINNLNGTYNSNKLNKLYQDIDTFIYMGIINSFDMDIINIILDKPIIILRILYNYAATTIKNDNSDRNSKSFKECFDFVNYIFNNEIFLNNMYNIIYDSDNNYNIDNPYLYQFTNEIFHLDSNTIVLNLYNFLMKDVKIDLNKNNDKQMKIIDYFYKMSFFEKIGSDSAYKNNQRKIEIPKDFIDKNNGIKNFMSFLKIMIKSKIFYFSRFYSNKINRLFYYFDPIYENNDFSSEDFKLFINLMLNYSVKYMNKYEFYITPKTIYRNYFNYLTEDSLRLIILLDYEIIFTMIEDDRINNKFIENFIKNIEKDNNGNIFYNKIYCKLNTNWQDNLGHDRYVKNNYNNVKNIKNPTQGDYDYVLNIIDNM